MSIANFPAALQPIIQLGYLEREFEQALRSKLGYRAVADRMSFSVGIGETLTKTRAGLKAAVTRGQRLRLRSRMGAGFTRSSVPMEWLRMTWKGGSSGVNRWRRQTTRQARRPS